MPLGSFELEDQPADAERFGPNGTWAAPPQPWVDEDPESLFARKELTTRLDAALDELPERQREVVVLRDVLGWTSEEVCNALALEETNQRVLLHRGRTRLRALLEQMLKAKSP